MSTKSAALITAEITAKRDYFAGGTLEILDGSSNVLVTATLTGVGGTIAGAVWTLAFTAASYTATGAGVAASAVLKTSGGSAGITGFTVGNNASAAEVKLDNTNIAIGQTIRFNTVTLTQS